MEHYYEKFYKHHAPPCNALLHRDTDRIASVKLPMSSKKHPDPNLILAPLQAAGFNGILLDCTTPGGKLCQDPVGFLSLFVETATQYSMQCGLDIPCAFPGKTSRTQQTFRKQLRDLLSCGIPFFEIRLNNTEQMGQPEWEPLFALIRQLQPDAVISGGPDRRRGNSGGHLPPLSSSRYTPRDCFQNGEAPNNPKSIERHYALGNPFNGLYYLQPECDIPFPATAEQMVESYLESAGNGGIWNVRIPTDEHGLLSPETEAILRASGEKFQSLRANEILTWHLNDGEQMLELYPTSFDLIELTEDMTSGERIRFWKIEGKNADQWQTLAEGTIIGFRRLRRLKNACQCTLLRLTVTGGGADLKLYSSGN